MSILYNYKFSHILSFQRGVLDDSLIMKGGLDMEQIKIGSFLKKLRKERKLTQGEVAEKLNVSSRSVSRWETGNTLPDISILIELSEFYEVDIKEILDGERQSEDMNDETTELMNKVVDYTSKDKEVILEKTQKYSGIAGILLLTGKILSVFDFSNRFQHITEILFEIALIFIIDVWLTCSGKVSEMKKDESKLRKYVVILVVALIVMVIFIFAMLGIIN